MGDRASLGPAIPIYDMGTGMGKPIEMTKISGVSIPAGGSELVNPH
jgi:hypothetical protein